MEDNLKKSFLNESIIILAFTCLSYYIYYSYYISYLAYFGVSEIFLEFDVIKVIFPVSIIFSFLFLSFILFKLPERYYIERANRSEKLKIIFFISLTVGSYFIFLLTNNLTKTIFLSIILFIIFLGVKALIKLFVYLSIKFYKNKIGPDYKKKSLKNIISDKFFIITLCFYFVIIASPLIGQIKAEKQKQFEIININGREVVILERFNDSLVVSDFDQYNKELIRGISLISLNTIQENNYRIHNKEIGPLTQKFSVNKGFEMTTSFRGRFNSFYSNFINLFN